MYFERSNAQRTVKHDNPTYPISEETGRAVALMWVTEYWLVGQLMASATKPELPKNWWMVSKQPILDG